MTHSGEPGEKRGSHRRDFLDVFEKGKAFTEELMRENERLRMQVLKLEKANLEIGSSVDQVRLKQLQEENRGLHNRLARLESRFAEVEQENEDFAHRYVEIQEQNDNLLNLYVASYQLHSTLEMDQVVRTIEEIVLNLIGAEEYTICAMEEKKPYPTILAAETAQGTIRHRTLSDPHPLFVEVWKSGVPWFAEPEDAKPPFLACIPLTVNDEVVGVIVITKLMDQKRGRFSAVDLELMNLLADHAATALVSARLYGRTQRKLETVQSFIELLKLNPSEPVGEDSQ